MSGWITAEIMSDTELTTLEQHLLLAVIALHPNAYGVSIRDHINERTGRVTGNEAIEPPRTARAFAPAARRIEAAEETTAGMKPAARQWVAADSYSATGTMPERGCNDHRRSRTGESHVFLR
jgi:hypothetical protein